MPCHRAKIVFCFGNKIIIAVTVTQVRVTNIATGLNLKLHLLFIILYVTTHLLVCSAERICGS